MNLRLAPLALLPAALPARVGEGALRRGGWREMAAAECPVPVAAPGLRCFVASPELDPAKARTGLSVYFSAVHDAERLFVNGQPVGATPAEFARGPLPGPVPWLGGYRRVYPLPQGTPVSGRNSLVLHAACTGEPCGPTGAWAVARDRDAFAWQWSGTIVNLALSGALLLGALIFLALGWNLEGEPEHHRFAAFLGAGALTSALHEPAWAPERLRLALHRADAAADALLLPLFISVLLAAAAAPTAAAYPRATRLLAGLALLPLLLPAPWIGSAVFFHKLAGSALLALLMRELFRGAPLPFHADNRRELLAACAILTAGAAGDLLISRGWWRPSPQWLDTVMPLALVSAVCLAALALARRYRILQLTAYRDPLTGLNSRRLMNEQIPGELARADRLGLPVTALFCDIDLFKRVNDRWGHVAGDRALREVARRLDHARREGDLLCRWGGEEFAVFLIGQDREAGQAAGERLRAAVAQSPIPLGPSLPDEPVTISVGVASLPARQGMNSLLAAADEALCEAKRSGRNRVATHHAALM